MLKLELSNRGHDVSVRLRDRERLVTRSFLIALAITASIHLSWFLLFDIQPFRIGTASNVLPPSQVDVVLSSVQDDTLLRVASEIEQDKKRGRHSLEPFIIEPPIPGIPEPNLHRNLDDIFAIGAESNPFTVIEKDLSHLAKNASEEPLAFAPFTIDVSGPLSEKELVFEKPSLKTAEKIVKRLRVQYEVQVENRTGEIIFVKRIETFGDPSLESKADALLKTLTFAPADDPFLTKGLIEISLAEEPS